MANCSFCGNYIEKGTGKIVIDRIGKPLPFCSMKCEKNLLKLKRDPKKTKWTKFYKK